MCRAAKNAPLVAAVVMSAALTATAQDAIRSILVSGEGIVHAPPDMATIQSGVSNQAATAADAVAANNLAMQRIMAVVKEHHVAAKDVQTSAFSVNPIYKTSPRNRTPQVAGFRASNQVRVRIRNLPELGSVLDALVRAGSNQVSGITFGIDDVTGLMNQARLRAFSDARSRANLYANAAGGRLGPVQSISERTMETPRPQPMMRSMSVEGAGSVPVATGEQQIRAYLQVIYALEDAN